MIPTVNVNMELLAEIEKTTLSADRLRWKEDVKNAPYKIHVDRQKYATESWKENAGEDLELRRAKLYKNIADNVAVNILDYDHIVGRIGPTCIGGYTAIDINGDYLDGLWNEDGIQATLHDKTVLSKEELEILRKAVRTFKNQNPVDCVNKVFADVLGD